MDSPYETEVLAWPDSMVGARVLHLETGVYGTVVAILNDPRLNEPSIQLDNNHILLARSPTTWLPLSAEAEVVITTFSKLVNEAVQFSAQQAVRTAPELKDKFAHVIALVLNLHAIRIGERG